MSIEHDRRSTDPTSAIRAAYNRVGATIREALAVDRFNTKESLELLKLLYAPLQISIGPTRIYSHDQPTEIFHSSISQLNGCMSDDQRMVLRLSLQGFLNVAEEIAAARSQIAIDTEGKRFEERSPLYFSQRQSIDQEFFAAIHDAQLSEQQLKLVDKARATLTTTRGDLIAISHIGWDIAATFQNFYLCTLEQTNASANASEQVFDKFIDVVMAGLTIRLPQETAEVLKQDCLQKLKE